MDTPLSYNRPVSVSDAENWVALGAGAFLLIVGAAQRSALGACLAASSAPLLYRGVTGRWPAGLNGRMGRDDTRSALGGSRGFRVRESTRVERPVADVYAFWRRLENLPRVFSHLDCVKETSARLSQWAAKGPADLVVEWEADIINDVPNETLAWQSVPGSDVSTAGSVTFEPIRAGRGTQVTVNLQYAPPAGKAGAMVAALFGRKPSQMIREDLRRLKYELEAGEVPRATATV